MQRHRPAIPKLNGLARRFNNGVVKPETKWTDPFYLTPAYRDWANLRRHACWLTGARLSMMASAAPRHGLSIS